MDNTQPKQPVQTDQAAPQPEKPVTAPQPISPQDTGMSTLPRRRSSLRWVIGGLIGLVVLLLIAVVVAYYAALRPVDSGRTDTQLVEVVSGATPDQIGELLKEKSLIRSEFAFRAHTRLYRVQNNLQAGTYKLSQSQSTQDIVATLTAGSDTQELEITFLPGATLADHRKVLQEAGFSGAAIDAAFGADYDHPLFASRPAGAGLEGYIYGETHRFSTGTSVEQILTQYFDDFYAVVQENQLVERYKAQGLTLFEGITLASIIQRESGGEDKAQIAQVFYLRYKEGMPLGSDVTYQYIADKLGVPRDTNLDNPYNTRRHVGLPPGPIASPGKEALIATGSPAEGDYLYFLSGDDDVTYFARTLEQHEANIRDHCAKKCQII